VSGQKAVKRLTLCNVSIEYSWGKYEILYESYRLRSFSRSSDIRSLSLELFAAFANGHAADNGGCDIEAYIHVSQLHSLSDRRPFTKPIEESAQIDWNAIKQRLHVCTQGHRCSDHAPNTASLPGFQVIDCTTRQIVPKQGRLDFAALSYVWGPGTSTGFGSHMPTPAPPLVEDAMSCTLAIGLRYLWIDRYCIEQKSAERHIMIQNMDKIYAGATITIINAAGEGANCRLPGVSLESSRETLPSAAIRRYTFELIPNSRQEVLESKWSTRAWTYQEGYLARRRLVFTRTHIYMQCLKSVYCDHMFYHGSKDQLVAPWYGLSLPRDRHIFPATKDMSFIPTLPSQAINEYIRRDLSYEKDRLNAIMGIFRTLGHQLWGVPFAADCDDNSVSRVPVVSRDGSSGDSHSILRAFLEGLLWSPDPEDDRKPVVARRKNFPSWSWTGWKHLKKIRKDIFHVHDFEMDVRMMDDSKRELHIEQCVREMERGFNMYRFRPCL
jgi:hypothetical protein